MRLHSFDTEIIWVMTVFKVQLCLFHSVRVIFRTVPLFPKLWAMVV